MLPGTNGLQQPGGSPPPQPGDKRRISELCCEVAPPVLEFDPAGNLVSSWGGPGAGYQWPTSMHGITVDGKDNVWLTTNQGHQMLKFTRQGKFLLQVGREGQSKGNTDTASLSFVRTVDELRAENRTHRIVTTDEAVSLIASGQPLNLQPLAGGLPPDLAWKYLRRVTDEVMPRVQVA